MAKIDDAADQLIGFAEKLKPLTEVAETLKQLGSLEQAVAERKQLLGDITKRHDEARAVLVDTDAQIAVMRKRQEDEIAQHNENVLAIKVATEQRAAELLARANADAAALLDNATAERDQSQQTHLALIDAKKAELVDLHNKIEDATGHLDSIKAEYKATVERTEALKAAAKSVIGG